MPGWGNVFGFVFDIFGSKAERRRNTIAKLEKERDEILAKKDKANSRDASRLEHIANELGKLYKQGKNQ